MASPTSKNLMATDSPQVTSHKAGRSLVSRRSFLQRSSLVAGAAVLQVAPFHFLRSLRAQETPSKQITVGLIGLGAMGIGHVHRVSGDPGFRVLAVCDVDASRRENAKSIVETKYAAEKASGTYKGCAAYNDFREILHRPDIDAVVIVTPDHWHAPMSVEAAKAGKDIYCEKPVSLTLEEGQEIVGAVRRYGRVFQTGTQYRSIGTIRNVVQFVREGGLGKVKSVFTLWNNLGMWFGAERFRAFDKTLNPAVTGKSYVPLDYALPAERVPEGLDWDMWVGPAPWHPYNRLYHVNPSPGVVPWSFSSAFGVTSLTWHLAHSADVIQYALGMERSGPVEIVHPSSGEFPTLTCRYANGTLLHLVDNWGMVKDLYHAVPSNARLAGNFGGVFVGERGWLTSMTTGGPIEGGPDEVIQALNLKSREVNPGNNDHHANWLACIHSRKPASCDEEIGHRSASVGHLANLACSTRTSLKWHLHSQKVTNHAFANRLLHRPLRAPWSF